MRLAQWVVKICIVVMALGSMGQSKDCADSQRAVLKLFEDFLTGNGQIKGDIYISHLALMDAATKSIWATGHAELINEFAHEALRALHSVDARYRIDEAGHSVPNTDANAQKLAGIYWDPNLTRQEKVDRIIDELMTPHNVDLLISGTFDELPDGSIKVRAYLISRASRGMITDTDTLKPEELKCRSPTGPNKIVLCPATIERLRDRILRPMNPKYF